MKLSAKWLTALAALALLVVAVAGATRSAQAATGTVYVANEWSKITNESSVSGYITAGTVYATYPTSSRLTKADSNKLKIVVIDADLNATSTVYDDVASSIDTSTVGASKVISLTSATQPIAGTAADIKIRDGSCSTAAACAALTDLVANSTVSVTIGFAGDGTLAGWITVTSNVSGGSATRNISVEYPTSAVNTTTLATSYVAGVIRVKSGANSTGQFVWANETGLNTSRFVGFVTLAENGGATPQANSAAAGDSVAVLWVNSSDTVTIEYNDGGTTRTTTALVETSAPTVSITGPTHNSATQNRLPTFSGTVSETGAGLKLVQQVSGTTNVGPAGSFQLVLDRRDDPSNGTAVLDTPGTIEATVISGVSNAAESVSLGTVSDGQSSLTFSHTPLTALPNATITIPDHKVDWQVAVADLAGNIGFSDSNTADSTTAPLVTGGFQAHVVKIDQQIPAFKPNTGGCSPVTSSPLPTTVCENATGKVLDTVTGVDSTSSTNRSNVKTTFNDSVANVDTSDFSVALSTGGTHVPSGVTVKGAVVYLTLSVEIPSNATATVSIVGSISDLAGNGTTTGSVTAVDGLPPKLTVTLSGGTGTGTGSEDSTQLTKSTIKVTIVSDESLGAAPTVETFILSGASQNGPATSLAKGGNTFEYTIPTLGTDGDKATKVVAVDPNGNTATSGASTTKSYKLDTSLAAPTVSPTAGSTTSLKKPFITVDFGAGGEASSVTISEITLDGTNVTAQLVASTDKKKFFIVPSSNLSNAEHTVNIPATKAVDAAGNNNAAAITFKFTVRDRKTFDLALFAGWNLVSFPSDPVDPTIGTVFTNVAVDQVVAYDASDSANPWRIATRDAVSGAWTSTTETPLTAIRSGRGYWVRTSNFEPAKVQLVGPVEPGAGSPPPVAVIAAAKGWNLVGVVDTDRDQTEGASGAGLLRGATVVDRSGYLNGVSVQRVYKYSPATLSFVEVAGGTQLLTGDGLWVYIVPNADGTVPAITP